MKILIPPPNPRENNAKKVFFYIILELPNFFQIFVAFFTGLLHHRTSSSDFFTGLLRRTSSPDFFTGLLHHRTTSPDFFTGLPQQKQQQQHLQQHSLNLGVDFCWKILIYLFIKYIAIVIKSQCKISMPYTFPEWQPNPRLVPLPGQGGTMRSRRFVKLGNGSRQSYPPAGKVLPFFLFFL